MSQSYQDLIQKNFVDPSGKNKAKILGLTKSVISELINYLSSTDSRPLLPKELHYTFKQPVLIKDPQDDHMIIKSLQELLANSMNPHNPFYIGHMDSMSTVYSFLGDMIASAINNNMFSLEMSPFLTQLEYQLVQKFCDLFGYDGDAGGIILGGGSLANLQALIVARNYVLKASGGNLRKSDKQLTIICSELAHVSVKKSAMIMGMGLDSVKTIPVDNGGHMIVPKLEDAIIKSSGKGELPIAVVATMGTTVTGNIDPIVPISQVCTAYNVWLHADAIWGGGMILSKDHRHKIEGIHLADSLTFNPQKWMMVAKTCSLVLYKNKQLFEGHFRIRKDYVREHHIVTDLSEIGIPGTKRADVLKLWLSFQGMGLKGYERFVNHTMEMINYFQEKIPEYKFLKVAYPPETAMVCMRSEPKELSEDRWDKFNEDLQEYLLKEKNTFMSLPTMKGKKWLRIILLNPFLTKKIIDRVFDSIDQFHYQFKS